MNILHVIFDDNVKQYLTYVIALTDAISPYSENQVITNKYVCVPNAEVIKFDLKQWNILAIRNKFLHCLYTFSPDVVHVHGAWNYRSYQCLSMAHSRGFITVFSPYGGISMKNIKTDLWKKQIWRLLLYQISMIKRADFVLINTEKEERMLNTLGRAHNIVMLNNSESSASHSQIVNLYQKAIDAQHLREVSVKTLFTIGEQLHALLGSNTLPMVSLSSIEKKQYDIFCKQQRLVETLDGTYTTPLYNEEDARGEIRKMFRQLKQCLAKKKATFNDVFQLATVMQNNDYDEDRLLDELDKEKLLLFARRIIQIADELCGVTMGFMPCLPLNDEKTVSIKVKLFNANQSF